VVFLQFHELIVKSIDNLCVADITIETFYSLIVHWTPGNVVFLTCGFLETGETKIIVGVTCSFIVCNANLRNRWNKGQEWLFKNLLV